MTNSAWGAMLNQQFVKPKQGYAAHHLEHAGSNPMYSNKMAQAYRPKEAKLGSKNVPGSPWIYMKGK